MQTLNKSVIDEWTDTAKRAAKRYFVSDNGQTKEPVADYFANLMSSYFNEAFKQRMKNKGIEDVEEQTNARMELFNEAFWKSQRWWQKEDAKHRATLAKYAPILKEAEEIGNAVDVSDIHDGFPCGWVSLYLGSSQKDTDLGKALRRLYTGDSYSAKVCYWSAYKIPVSWKRHGQCVSYDERIAKKVKDFLRSKGIDAETHTIID